MSKISVAGVRGTEGPCLGGMRSSGTVGSHTRQEPWSVSSGDAHIS